MYLWHCAESQAKSTTAMMQMNDVVKRKGKKSGGGLLVKMRGESEKTLPGSCSSLG